MNMTTLMDYVGYKKNTKYAFVLSTLLVLCACSGGQLDESEVIASDPAATSLTQATSPAADESTVEFDSFVLDEIFVKETNTASIVRTPTDDCLALNADAFITINSEGIRFCYQQPTRTLSAFLLDDTLWWSFKLPGTDVENKVNEILATEDVLVIFAKLNQRGKAELSTFDFNGAFISTVQIEEAFNYYKQYSSLATFSINDDIIFLGTCRGSSAGTNIILVDSKSGKVNTRCLEDRVFSGTAIVKENSFLLTLNGRLTEIESKSLDHTIGFDVQAYSMGRRTEIRDRLLANITFPLHAIPSVTRRITKKIRSSPLDPNGNPAYRKCEDGGYAGSEWISGVWNGQTTDYTDCLTDDFSIETGSIVDASSSYCGCPNGVAPSFNSKHYRLKYVFKVIDSSNNEQWSFSTDTSSSLGHATIWSSFYPKTFSKRTVDTGYLVYSNESGKITMDEANYTNSNTRMMWKGRFSTESYTFGTSESVDIDIFGEADDDDKIQLSGYISADLKGEDSQTFTMEVLSGVVPMVRYTIVTNGDAVSLEEPW